MLCNDTHNQPCVAPSIGLRLQKLQPSRFLIPKRPQQFVCYFVCQDHIIYSSITPQKYMVLISYVLICCTLPGSSLRKGHVLNMKSADRYGVNINESQAFHSGLESRPLSGQQTCNRALESSNASMRSL